MVQSYPSKDTTHTKLIDIAKHCVVRLENHEKYTASAMNPYEEVFDIDLGTGFFIDNEHVLTNEHVVQNHDKVFMYVLGSDQAIEMEVLWIQPKIDFAILKQKEDPSIETYVPKMLFPIGNSSTINIDEKLSVFGYPLAGLYNGIKQENGFINGWEKNKIQMDANTNPGMSGSPVIVNGKIVGLHKEGHPRTPGNINFAAPINIIKLNRILSLKIKGFVHIPQFPFIAKNIAKNHQDYLIWKYYLDKDFSGIMVVNGNNNIKPRDIITHINSIKIRCDGMIDLLDNHECIIDFSSILDYHMAGDTMIIRLLRATKDDNYKEITIKETFKGCKVGKKVKPQPNALVLRDLILQDINSTILEELGIFNTDIQGIIVSHVYDLSRSYLDDTIDPGTIICKVNNEVVESVDDIKRILLESSKLSKNPFIIIETGDGQEEVLRKTEILNAVDDDFSGWKIPCSDFYNKLKKVWY